METFPTLLALWAGNSPVTGEFPTQRPVTWSFGVFFDLRLNKRWSKQSWGWWFEMPSRSLWIHQNVNFGASNGLVPAIKQQSITWASVDPALYHHIVIVTKFTFLYDLYFQLGDNLLSFSVCWWLGTSECQGICNHWGRANNAKQHCSCWWLGST